MFKLITGLFLLTAIGFGVTACGSDDDSSQATATAATTATVTTTGDSQLGQQDRDRIQQTVMDYIAALHDQDQTRMRDMLRTPGADLTRALDRARDRLYQFIEMTGIATDGPDRVTVTIRLRDKDGNVETATLDLERDQDTWRIRDPELH